MRVIRFSTESGYGPFSSGAEFQRLTQAIKRNCAVSHNFQCRTFLDFYMQTVPCPAESNKQVRTLLHRNPYGTFKFAFKDQDAVARSFGLKYSAFAEQYEWVLESNLLVRNEIDIEPALILDTEVMYYATEIDQASEQYEKMFGCCVRRRLCLRNFYQVTC